MLLCNVITVTHYFVTCCTNPATCALSHTPQQFYCSVIRRAGSGMLSTRLPDVLDLYLSGAWLWSGAGAGLLLVGRLVV